MINKYKYFLEENLLLQKETKRVKEVHVNN